MTIHPTARNRLPSPSLEPRGRRRGDAGRCSARRGSVYLLVLGTAVVVSVMGLSAILLSRVQRRGAQAVADVTEAKTYAQAALRIGMLRIQNNPDWRFVYPNGTWESDVPIGVGTYSLEGIDPSDSDLTDDADDPLVLIGTGKRGRAVHKTQITLAPAARGFSCLEAALHAGNDLKPRKNSTIYCDQTLSANHDVAADTASVYGDVQAANSISGGTYYGTTQTGITARTMPDTNSVFDYYLANGTWIDKDSLPLGYPNVLKNPGFEAGTTDWTEAFCDIAQDTGQAHSGSASVKVTNRYRWYSGPQQAITDIIQNGTTYDVQGWVKMLSFLNVSVEFRIKVSSSGSGIQYFTTAYTDVKRTDGWKLVTGTITPSWTGTLNYANVRIRTQSGDPVTDYYADDIVLKESGTERTISHVLLSPTSNPFGPTTNPQGIYVIDLADTKIFIKYCRIVGTLVLLTPNAGSRIGDGGPVTWEPAVPSFPALMVQSTNVTINPGNAGLVEDACQENFNPPGCPYAGLGEDSDQDDTYPSEIRGLIYGTNKIKLKGQTTLIGSAVSATDIEVKDTLDVTYNPVHYISPPPGFNGPEEIRILLDSARKATD